MDPVQVIKEYFSAFSSGNVQNILRLLDEKVVWNVAGATNVSTVGLLQGKEQVKKWLENFPKNFQPIDFEIDNFFAKGTDVLVTGRFRHKIITTHRVAGSDLVIYFSVINGLITKYQIFEDSAILSQAFNKELTWGTSKQRINGNVYAYQDTQLGNGSPILFAHGLFVTNSIFTPQIESLSKTHRCINLDLLGHGESDTPNHSWTLEDVADDLALFITENHIPPVTYVGLSQGGMIGIRFAAKYPELVNKLILIGTSARAEFPERIHDWQTMKKNILNGDHLTVAELFTELQAKILPDAWLANNPEKAMKERQVMLSNNRKGLALSIDAAVINRTDVRTLLPTIQAQTMVICGKLDNATPIDVAEEIVDGIPEASLEIIPDVGHHAPLEAPEVINNLIRNFIQ